MTISHRLIVWIGNRSTGNRFETGYRSMFQTYFEKSKLNKAFALLKSYISEVPKSFKSYIREITIQVEQSAKEPVGSADFMGAVFRWTDLSGSAWNQQEPVKTGSWIRSPDLRTGFLAFSGGCRLETVSFLRVFAENSRNTASGIIVLGKGPQVLSKGGTRDPQVLYKGAVHGWLYPFLRRIQLKLCKI